RSGGSARPAPRPPPGKPVAPRGCRRGTPQRPRDETGSRRPSARRLRSRDRLRGPLVDEPHQPPQIVGIRLGHDAVPEVEDVTGTAFGAAQYVLRLALDALPR